MAEEIPTVKYGVIAAEAIKTVQGAVAAIQEIQSAPFPKEDTTNFKPTKLSPGKFVGDQWVQDDGYVVDKKWVAKYPALFGPLRQDPDGGFGEIESDDIIAKLSAKFTGYGGTFSTWTERHAFITFAGIGFNDVSSSADVPPIPDYFIGEMAYCYAGLTMGRAAKKIDESGGLKKIAGYLVAGVALGNVPRIFGLLTSGAI